MDTDGKAVDGNGEGGTGEEGKGGDAETRASTTGPGSPSSNGTRRPSRPKKIATATKVAAKTVGGGAKKAKYGVDDWWETRRFKFYLSGILLAITLAFLWPRIFITIQSGHQGVKYLRFGGGTVVSKVWGEGFHIIAPWDKLIIYETRILQKVVEFPVLTQEGLEIQMHVSVRFQPTVTEVGHLHQEVGPDYFNRLIVPEVQAHLRRTMRHVEKFIAQVQRHANRLK